MKPEDNKNRDGLQPTLSIRALLYLEKKVPLAANAMTRLEAYLYLVDKQLEYVNDDYEKGLAYYYPVLISRLAEKWAWHRETVSSFMHQLKDMMVIDSYHEGKILRVRVLLRACSESTENLRREA